MTKAKKHASLPVLRTDVTGSGDADFARGLLAQLVTIGAVADKPDVDGTLFAISVIRGVEPRDQIEAMLATQMAATQNAIIMLYRQLSTTQSLEVQDSAERSLGRMSRLFMQQMEALKRHRDNRPRSLGVANVTVNDGGQAFLGDFENSIAAPRLAAPEQAPVAIDVRAKDRATK